jgi:hypothetical protein
MVGSAIELTDRTAKWKTSAFDLGSRDSKSIEYLELGTDADWTASAEWKNANINSFVTCPSIPVRRESAGRLKISGVDFKLRLTCNVPAELDYVTVRYKQQARRFKRGADATKTAA